MKISSAAVIFLLLALVLPHYSFGQTNDREGTITFIKGTCLIKLQVEEYKEALLNQSIYTGSIVKTLRDSEAEITLSDGNIIFLTEDTEITLHNYRIREKRYKNLGLLFGNIRLFVSKFAPGSDEFSVNTITTTAGIRGTEFDVSVREDGAVLINVEQGFVETELNGEAHTIQGGNSSIYSLTEEREDFDKRIDPKEWQRKALQKIRENPEIFLKKMLERERAIIEALKTRQKNIDEYRKEWITFLRRVQYLENRKMYKEEKRVIELQIAKTKQGIQLLVLARRHLSAIRSIIVLVARIESYLDSETVKKLPSIPKLREEYQRLRHVIRKINETERKLVKVLFVLNKKYDELNRKIQ